MLRNYLVVAVRNLLRHKVYSAINVCGLCIGLASCGLVLLLVQHELSYDRFHSHRDSIHRVLRGTSATTPYALGQVLVKSFPEDLEVVRLARSWRRQVERGDKRFVEEGFVYADASFFEIFSFPLAQGDRSEALRQPFTVVITQAIARKYFGDADPMGKTLTIGGDHDYVVSGVAHDAPSNSHFRFDLVATLVGAEAVLPRISLGHWGMSNFYTYLLLRDPGEAAELEPRLSDAIVGPMKAKNPELSPPTLRLQSVKDIHLSGGYIKHDIAPQSDVTYVAIWTGVACLILLIGVINFVNLTTARSVARVKEVGIRKVVGARRKQLVWQFLGESVIITGVAFLAALALVDLFLPLFRDISGRPLPDTWEGNWAFLGAFGGISLLTGLAAGCYPGLWLSSFQPARILRGRAGVTPGGTATRRALVVAQFAISIALIICAAIVHRQVNFLKTKRLGFNTDLVMATGTPPDRETFKSRVAMLASVTSVTSASHLPPGGLGLRQIYRLPGSDEDLWINTLHVDQDYFRTLGVPLAEGRVFRADLPTDRKATMVLNESAVKHLGLETPLGTLIRSTQLGGEGSVIGVVKDFHLEPLYQSIRPTVFLFQPNGAWRIAIRIARNENLAHAVSLIEQKWEEHAPEEVFEYHFLDDRIEAQYRNEEKAGRTVSGFSALALVVSCLGLLGLSSCTIGSRVKEIGIRRAMGAQAASIAFLLTKGFIAVVVAANAFAWPIAYFAMGRWLQHFPYRTELGLSVFLIGGLIALLLAIATVSYQAIKAALRNPVDALRCE